MEIFKIILQLLMVVLIIGTIKRIKDNDLKYKIESYILSIIIYTVVIMLLF